MTHVCCPGCRLRFTPAAGEYLVACPECDGLPQIASLERVVGFRLFKLEDPPQQLPEAIAVAIPLDDPGETQCGRRVLRSPKKFQRRQPR